MTVLNSGGTVRTSRWIVSAAWVLLSGCAGVSQATYQSALDRNKELEQQNRELAEASRNSGPQADEIRRLNEERSKRIALLRKFVDGVRSALGGKGIDVTIRNGRMLVNIPEAILFDSGKADLKGGANQVLDTMAALIQDTGDRSFRVTGYTDNLPIKTNRFASNWELSASRAVTVVHYLVHKGVTPAKLAANGRADNEAVGDNATEQGRTMNRRVEFVLEPDLSELPDMSAVMISHS